jgi:hypothetical protein
MQDKAQRAREELWRVNNERLRRSCGTCRWGRTSWRGWWCFREARRAVFGVCQHWELVLVHWERVLVTSNV